MATASMAAHGTGKSSVCPAISVRPRIAPTGLPNAYSQGTPGHHPSSGPSSQGEGPLSLELNAVIGVFGAERMVRLSGMARESKRHALEGRFGIRLGGYAREPFGSHAPEPGAIDIRSLTQGQPSMRLMCSTMYDGSLIVLDQIRTLDRVRLGQRPRAAPPGDAGRDFADLAGHVRAVSRPPAIAVAASCSAPSTWQLMA